MNGVKNFSIKQKNNNWLRILIGAGALLLLVFVLNIFATGVKNCFYAISSPIQKTFWSAGESSSFFVTSFFKAGSLAKENENLRNENQKLLSEVASLQSIQQGNQAQSEVSAACQNTGFKTVMVGVNGLDNDILSLNKGSASGIAVGMPVINQQNVLYGKVIKVYKNFSQVMIISNKGSVVNVKIQNDLTNADSEIDGVLKGNGGLKAYLDLISVADNINSGDILLTSSLDKSFPKDLLVGKVAKVEKNDQSPFQQAETSLFFDIKTIDNLFVITNYKQTN